MHVYGIILYINCVFVQIRTGCCGNFLCLRLHLANTQVRVCRTIGPQVVIFDLVHNVKAIFHLLLYCFSEI